MEESELNVQNMLAKKHWMNFYIQHPIHKVGLYRGAAQIRVGLIVSQITCYMYRYHRKKNVLTVRTYT